jgi:hypothetical protein
VEFANGPYENYNTADINGRTYPIYRYKNGDDHLVYTELGGFWRVRL